VAEKDDYLLDLLVDLGFTNAGEVAKAREEAAAANVGVVDLLLANKIIRPTDVAQAKAAQFGAEVVNLGGMKIEDDVISIIPRHVAKKYRVIPLFKADGKVAVALADPATVEADAPIIKLVNTLIVEAFKARASDIHLEPLTKRFRVRYRIDGVLHEMKSPPKRLQASIISRLKIQSNMSIAERRIPQDGRIQTQVGAS
jgi:hypothetical protein